MRIDTLAAHIAAALSLAFAGSASAQSVFSENFTDPGGCTTSPSATNYFPPTWTRFNVDNRTPNSAVSYVNNAWIVRGDFAGESSPATNCVAFSTSWYTPAGAANDFMCTPQITLPAASRLSWKASTYDASYPDGYEVRIMRTAPTGGTGTIGNLLTASNVVFSTAAETPDVFVTHTVDLHTVAAAQGGPYTNEPVYVCFRNNSNDKFLLIVDDVAVDTVVGTDALVELPAGVGEYTIVPSDIGATLPRSVTVRNNGSTAVTQVVVTAETLREGLIVDTDAAPAIASLAAGASQVVTFDPAPLDTDGTYQIRYTVDVVENDGNTANDVVLSAELEVGGDEIARDDGVENGTLGIGAGDGGELGQHFDIGANAVATGVHFWTGAQDPLATEWTTLSISANLRAWDPVAQEPGALIATTESATPTDFAAHEWLLDFPTPQNLAPGRYVVTVNEPIFTTEGQSLPLSTAENIFTEGTVWVNWPSTPLGGWANSEEFGASFENTFRVRLVFGDVTPPPDPVFADGFESAPVRPAPANATGDATRRATSATRHRNFVERLSD